MFKGGGRKSDEKRVAVFAGTTEGRLLAEFVLERGLQDRVDFLVATEYGNDLLSEEGSLNVFTGRMDAEEMTAFFERRNISLVIDATHPYAEKVTKNIVSACGEDIEYLRVYRESEFDTAEDKGIIRVSDVKEAAAKVEELALKTLVTTGSKEIAEFGTVKNSAENIVARVLPSVKSIEACLEAGISPANIVAMQGPFTLEMNVATLKQYGCEALVTKDTGKPGGFDDKAKCADLGFKVIVVKRPSAESGVSLREAEERISEEIG